MIYILLWENCSCGSGVVKRCSSVRRTRPWLASAIGGSDDCPPAEPDDPGGRDTADAFVIAGFAIRDERLPLVRLTGETQMIPRAGRRCRVCTTPCTRWSARKGHQDDVDE